MQLTSELREQLRKLRGSESVTRLIGGLALGAATVATAGLAVTAEKYGIGGTELIPETLMALGDIAIVCLGAYSLSDSASYGRRADLREAELLRRDSK